MLPSSMMSASNKITIAVPTYNRCKVLMECLGSIQAQSMPDFECYVLDDGGSTDETPDLVRALAATDPRFHYISIDQSGCVVARNKGFYMGEASLLLTLDDDVELTDSSTLAYIVGCFEADSQLGILGLSEYYPGDKGKDGNKASPERAKWNSVWKNTKLYMPGKVNRWGFIGSQFLTLPFNQIHEVDHVRSSSMAIRREAFEAVGGFFEPYTAMGLGYRYETDLCLRIKRQGYKVVYSAQHPQSYHKTAERARGWKSRTAYQDANYILFTNRNNTFFFLRNFWSPLTAWIFFLFDLFVGNTTQPGVLRLALNHRHVRGILRTSMRGKWWGWKMYWIYRGKS